MPLLAAFHDVLFPIAVGLKATGGPERRTEIVALGSGHEQRNARWADSRRRFDAGTGVRTLADLATVVSFFEQRRGRLHGFRYRDPLDDGSAAPGVAPAPGDQPIGDGDGAIRVFQLTKSYGAGADAWVRTIEKPVATGLRIAVAGVEKTAGTDFSVDAATGLITFALASTPAVGAAVSAGFKFHVPVRFDTDQIRVDLAAFAAGEIPSIPLIEIRP